MTNIIQFAYHSCQRMRRGDGHWYMYKPVYLVTLSTPMVLLQPTCMLIIGSWICDGNFSADQLTGAVCTARTHQMGALATSVLVRIHLLAALETSRPMALSATVHLLTLHNSPTT